ncbi:helicase c2 [Leptothrix cholodnii SP-6]|uniref:DNA 5'-3' helicase n=1 Tax=Leptothrix cholodnii (strain ATCC 51168 / LMG 8142 / SP-6) TaxID=395495 RepID=B1XY97_LEPCP|nr:ATP-dependent DNA helicase [Leptothrix cholodnii]ACB35142.1 helicase c2 [Leptothrix cholodnii SP-6]
MTPVSALREEVALAFAATGVLARTEKQFRPREVQTRLADAVAHALEERSVLVAEAGTGVGKTYAYLVPLLLSGLRALVSTATKSLQDQLYLRDLPRLVQLLGLPVQVALLKGRASYLCLHRLDHARHTAELPDRHSLRVLARVEQWSKTTRSGDLAELEVLDERSPVIPLVTSNRENCLGSDCPQFRQCHLVQARREAMQADIVVVNHHLFFADMALRDTGMAELLPSVDAVVFDEAHQLNEAGVQFLGRHIGTGQLLDIGRDLLAAGLAHARGLQDWQALAGAVEQGARRLRLACAGTLRAAGRLRWDERGLSEDFVAALTDARAACVAASDALGVVADAAPDLAKLQERAQALAAQLAAFLGPVEHGHVRWIDLTLHQARLAESPLDIRETLREQIEGERRAWIFTSATLGDDPALSWFTRSAGVEDAHTLRAGSPFDYGRNARLFVPARFPRPSEATHPAAVSQLAARCAQALGGRCFVLTTTLRALQGIGADLRARLATLPDPIDVLVQGEAPKRALMARFLATPRAVLVGSHSFWEGIDVPGSALQCVLIDKLPFPPPNDPLAEARCRSLEAQGGKPFDDYFIPEAAVALKQGAGRLIRSETDRGLLVICDTRLLTMNYGRRLMGALPPMPLVGDEAEALQWLASLARPAEPA